MKVRSNPNPFVSRSSILDFRVRLACAPVTGYVRKCQVGVSQLGAKAVYSVEDIDRLVDGGRGRNNLRRYIHPLIPVSLRRLDAYSSATWKAS